MHMNCKKKCSCKNCEMLMLDEPIVEIKTVGLSEYRKTINGVKCMNYGQIAKTPEELKKSNLIDSFIYI